MLTTEQALRIRPMGPRLLVKRLALPDQSVGGIFVLGRDYPTLGEIIRWGDAPTDNVPWATHWTDVQCQWTIGTDFDTRIIADDVLLLNYTDLNYVVLRRAHACGDRLIIEPLPSYDFFETRTRLANFERIQDGHWGLGKVVSVGPGRLTKHNRFIANDAVAGDTVVYNRFKISETKLSGQLYHIVRNDDIIAQLERLN